MTYALSSQITSVDNVEFNGLSCPIISNVSAGTKITITTTPTMTGVSKSASNELVLSSGASYMVEASLALFRASTTISCFSVVQWYNSTDSVYIGQEAVIRTINWFSQDTRVCRFVCRALILDSDFTGSSMTIYPNTKSTNGGGAYGLSGFLSPSIQIWRIS